MSYVYTFNSHMLVRDLNQKVHSPPTHTTYIFFPAPPSPREANTFSVLALFSGIYLSVSK